MNELGKFELPVLVAVARLGGNGYGVSIMDECSKREGREVAYGSVHVTLDRLCEKGFVSSKMGEPTAERGGRRKRYYAITGKGEAALDYVRSMYKSRVKGLRWFSPKPAEG